MNVKTLIAASVVALLGATQVAVAQEAPKTRAQVTAELAAARSAGQLDNGANEVGLPAPIVKSNKSRAQVQAEFVEAREAGLSFNGSRSEVFDAPAATQRTRAEVRAEVRDAIAHGERLSHGSASN
jgi:hypothetical protein